MRPDLSLYNGGYDNNMGSNDKSMTTAWQNNGVPLMIIFFLPSFSTSCWIPAGSKSGVRRETINVANISPASNDNIVKP